MKCSSCSVSVVMRSVLPHTDIDMNWAHHQYPDIGMLQNVIKTQPKTSTISTKYILQLYLSWVLDRVFNSYVTCMWQPRTHSRLVSPDVMLDTDVFLDFWGDWEATLGELIQWVGTGETEDSQRSDWSGTRRARLPTRHRGKAFFYRLNLS